MERNATGHPKYSPFTSAEALPRSRHRCVAVLLTCVLGAVALVVALRHRRQRDAVKVLRRPTQIGLVSEERPASLAEDTFVVNASRASSTRAPLLSAPAMPVPSLFCFSYTRTSGAEWENIRYQFVRNVSIFACDEWAAFSIGARTLGRGFSTTSIKGPPAVIQHWNFVVVLNTDVFLRAWEMIKETGQWSKTQWTVKADVDTVFFPERLREHIRWKKNPYDSNVYFKNCKWYNSLQGPLEVYSQAAVGNFFSKRWKCDQVGHNQFGEDIFMGKCMTLLNAKVLEDWDLVADQYCRTMTNACDCGGGNAWKPAFHPCKSSQQWQACYNAVAEDA